MVRFLAAASGSCVVPARACERIVQLTRRDGTAGLRVARNERHPVAVLRVGIKMQSSSGLPKRASASLASWEGAGGLSQARLDGERREENHAISNSTGSAQESKVLCILTHLINLVVDVEARVAR